MATTNNNDEGTTITPEVLAQLPFLKQRVAELEVAGRASQDKVGELTMVIDSKNRELIQAQQIINDLIEQFPERKRESLIKSISVKYGLV